MWDKKQIISNVLGSGAHSCAQLGLWQASKQLSQQILLLTVRSSDSIVCINLLIEMTAFQDVVLMVSPTEWSSTELSSVQLRLDDFMLSDFAEGF